METTKSYSDILAWQLARVGLSGIPREWTPSNWTTQNDNDCATFQSDAFFGDLRYWVVSRFYNDGAANGQLIPSARPGALACFRWPGSGDNFDHIGMVISMPDQYDNFQTIEANTSGPISGHQVAIKMRNARDVVGFVMPQYSAGQVVAPPAPEPKRKSKKMDYGIVKATENPSIYQVRLSDGAIRGIGYTEYAALLSAGCTLFQAPQADIDATIKVAPAW